VFGREPNALELDRLQRSAAFATCNAKSHDGETVEERLERWNTQLRAEVRGDLVQARRNAWELAGHHGNSRGAINREQYRVLRGRADGGLEVAPITRTPPVQQRRVVSGPASRSRYPLTTWRNMSPSATPRPCTPPIGRERVIPPPSEPP
jgi:hypothetical protein